MLYLFLTLLARVFTEAKTKLWSYIWAGGNDPGVQTASQEEEKARQEDEGPGIWWVPAGEANGEHTATTQTPKGFTPKWCNLEALDEIST